MRLSQLNISSLKSVGSLLVLALILSHLVACKENDKVTIIRHTMNPWEKDIGYAEAVEANGTVYISGVVCSGENYAQAVPDCYNQISDILKKLNLTTQNIVKENVYTKDIEAFKEQIPARKKFYGNDNYPAATWIEASRFYLPEHLVEVELIAVRTN